MKTKIVGIFVCMLLIATAIPAVGTSVDDSLTIKETSDDYSDLKQQINGGSWLQGHWVEQDRLIALDGAPGDLFGISVSIDGEYAIVGAFFDDARTGSAYVFKRSGTTWVQEDKLTASDGAPDDFFGCSVSTDGVHAIVGASSDNNGNGENAGSVYVFKRSDSGWIEEKKLIASAGAAYTYFGASVSIDGNYAAAGNPGTNMVYVFVKLIPDLECDGILSWTNVKPGDTVNSYFTIENIGNDGSELSWEIDSYPEWGTWNFMPSNGAGLTPGMGTLNVIVEVVAPNENNKEFTGDVKVVNSEDSNDYEIIPVSLKTPVNNAFSINILFLTFLEQHPHMFPILRTLLGL